MNDIKQGIWSTNILSIHDGFNFIISSYFWHLASGCEDYPFTINVLNVNNNIGEQWYIPLSSSYVVKRLKKNQLNGIYY